MPRRIFITGPTKADCIRIKDVLRRGFRSSIIHVNEASSPAENGVTVVSDSDESKRSEETQHVEVLKGAIRTISSHQPVEEVLGDVADRSQEVLGDMAFVFLRDGVDRPLRFLLPVSTKFKDEMPAVLRVLKNERETLNSGFRAFFDRGAPRIVEPESLELPIGLAGLVRQFGVKAVIAVPIQKDQETLGVFITVGFGARTFNQSDLGVAVGIADVMAAAIALDAWKQKANTDALTGLYNARLFDEILTGQVARAARLARDAVRGERRRTHLTLLTLDVDNFKQVNDHYGHPAGDEVLRSLAGILRSSVRREDFVFRFSGGADEFAVVLPDTDLENGLQVGEHIRRDVEAASLGPEGANVTVSVGVAEYKAKRAPDADETAKSEEVKAILKEGVETLRQQADEALYAAKKVKNSVQGYRGARYGRGHG